MTIDAKTIINELSKYDKELFDFLKNNEQKLYAVTHNDTYIGLCLATKDITVYSFATCFYFNKKNADEGYLCSENALFSHNKEMFLKNIAKTYDTDTETLLNILKKSQEYIAYSGERIKILNKLIETELFFMRNLDNVLFFELNHELMHLIINTDFLVEFVTKNEKIDISNYKKANDFLDLYSLNHDSDTSLLKNSIKSLFENEYKKKPTP